MKKLIVLMLCTIGVANSYAITVTSGATVTLNGTFFVGQGSWSLGTNAQPQDLVNGVFQPEGQQWNFYSVWWNGYDYPNNDVVLDLNGTFEICSFTVQADDNDVYRIEYRAPGDATWLTAWTIPAPGGWGLQTSVTALGSPITASALRFTAVGGDGFYSVSQIQAEGCPVPDGVATFGILSGALALLGLVRRFGKA